MPIRAAQQIANMMRIYEPLCLGDKTFSISVSIGLLCSMQTLKASLSAAYALCAAKTKGRNRAYVPSDDSELAQQRGEMQWAPNSQSAGENHFRLYSQRLCQLLKPRKSEH